MGIVYTGSCFNGEVGYNFWARQAECIKLDCAFPTGAAIKDEGGQGFTDPYQQINFRDTIQVVTPNNPPGGAAPNYTQSIITQDQLDLNSAAHPCALSHIVYGYLGYDFDWCRPAFVGVGGSYEFGPDNNAMDRWMVWGKIGVSF
jgi:hypothetical protein